MRASYEAVIGLEVHVQLLTRSKLFCGCRNAYGAAPNSLTCPVCLGLPGALPVLNGEAVRLALRLGQAIDARIQPTSTFYRKQYFYADLPKGYQITQGPVALVEEGVLHLPGDPEVRGSKAPIAARIERAHLEEDAGKSRHDLGEASHVDLNRAGVPLLEIVGAPDLRSPQEASDYLKVLHRLVTFLGLCDGNLEEGSFRCDANVSVRRAGESAYGTRVEVKNLNSFRFVKQALAYEIERHIGCLERGEPLVQETRGWDAEQGRTWSQRSKEAAMDYRYFPEPDLPALTVSEAEMAEAQASLPELPEARLARYRAAFGLGEDEAATLLQSPSFATYFEAVLAAGAPGRPAALWLLGEVSRLLNARGVGLEGLGLRPEHLAELVRLVEAGTLNAATAREEVLPPVLQGEGSPEAIVAARGLAQTSDPAAIEALVRQVVAAHPAQVAQVKAGQTKLQGFLVGQILKAGQGKVNPQLVNTTLAQILKEP